MSIGPERMSIDEGPHCAEELAHPAKLVLLREAESNNDVISVALQHLFYGIVDPIDKCYRKYDTLASKTCLI